ncbi:hypothetical protein DFQ01_13350 [Paenibacillus cellulosilyticus]|uniref:Uncharacterized protein n=1 Tax=Paenibacillus cellulosilyticus TaxID=375489 RepID=A0A2V2YKT2_9BACL|nr:hypothetical protein DFQ01_13350 [Paenibacillus cellulosilyticus]
MDHLLCITSYSFKRSRHKRMKQLYLGTIAVYGEGLVPTPQQRVQ